MNKNLKQLSDTYRTLLNSLPDAVYVIQDGKYIFSNQMGLTMLGYNNSEEFIGSDSLSVIAPEYIKLIVKRIRNISQHKTNQPIELEVIKKDGTRIWTESVSIPIMYEGSPAALVISHDHTQKREVERELKFQSQLLNNINDLITATDMLGIITYVNDAECKLFHKNRDELIGFPVSKYGHDPKYGASQNEIVEKTIKNGQWRGEIVNYTPEGQRIYLDCRTQLICDQNGEAIGLMGISTDITERKKNLDEIRRINEELAARNLELEQSIEQIREMNLELTLAKEKAEESDRLKSAFLANMSHEIRTPMNGIIGFSEMLCQEELSAEKRANYTKIIMDSSHQLLSIVSDILDIARLEAGKVDLVEEKVVLNDMIMDIFVLFKPKADEMALEYFPHKFLSDRASTIICDSLKLRQILTNLLSNAFKFTRQGRVVFGYDLVGQVLRFFVKDTGIGIPPEMREKIFESFRQVESHFSRNYRGTGLGLSIAHKIIKLFGGRIWLESIQGNGSCFYFEIPYQPVYENDLEDIDKTSAHLTYITHHSSNPDATVLIVEDEEINLYYMDEVLGKHRVQILHARNGKEAVELCRENGQIDLVLMDIKMPVMDGYQALKMIQSFRPELPIVAQTAHALKDDRLNILSKGFSDYLSKPITREQLVAMVKKWCPSV